MVCLRAKMIFDGASHDNFLLVLRQFWYLVVEDGEFAKKGKEMNNHCIDEVFDCKTQTCDFIA